MSKRALGVDLGARRIGLALSDASGTLARPFKTLAVTATSAVVAQLVLEIAALANEDDGLAVVVVGVPLHLDGQVSEGAVHARATIDALRGQTSVPVVPEDERLTSREAEQRLAVREKDWRKRKRQLDAAAAAVFLQDYLDRQRPTPACTPDDEDWR